MHRESHSFTLFYCSAFLPAIYTNCDSTTESMGANGDFWHFLHFYNSPYRDGMSMATGDGGRIRQQEVIGSEPSWLGKVVPSSFKNHETRQQSRGLGGDLGLVIGLMGLSQPQGQVSKAFRRGAWHGRQWHLGRFTVPSKDQCPRGVIVTVCLDDLSNSQGSTMEALENFQASIPLVKESS